MTQSEILYSIKEALGIDTDDRSWKTPDAYIMHEYETVRGMMVHQRVNRTRKVPDVLYQTVKLTMTLSSAADCGVNTDCKVIRSTQKIPSSVIHRYSGPMIDFIRSYEIRGAHTTLVTDSSKLNTLYGGRLAPVNEIFSYVLGGYLYLFSMNPAINVVDTVIMRAIFDQPSAIIDAGLCEGESCDTYPITAEIHTQAKQLTIQKLMQERGTAGRDVTNDASPAAQQEL